MKKRVPAIAFVTITALAFLLCFIVIVFFFKETPTDKFYNLSAQCVENDGDMMLELFQMYDNNRITWIRQVINGDTAKGLSVEYNHKEFDVGLPKNQAKELTQEEALRTCEIADLLMSKYSITDIHYYDFRKIEFWFPNISREISCAIVYYPLEGYPPEDNFHKEKYENISGGFYRMFYMNGH